MYRIIDVSNPAFSKSPHDIYQESTELPRRIKSSRVGRWGVVYHHGRPTSSRLIVIVTAECHRHEFGDPLTGKALTFHGTDKARRITNSNPGRLRGTCAAQVEILFTASATCKTLETKSEYKKQDSRRREKDDRPASTTTRIKWNIEECGSCFLCLVEINGPLLNVGIEGMGRSHFSSFVDDNYLRKV